MSSRSSGREPPHGRPSNRRARWIPGPLVVLALGIVPALLNGEAAWTPQSIDPHKVVKASRCGRCHDSEFKVWDKSEHARGGNTLAAKSAAQDIAGRMGIQDIQKNSLCLDCHYTPIAAAGSTEAASGVSCESCHGAAKDWIESHHNYGGGAATYETEPPEQRQQRIETTRAAGMFRPASVYDVVQNCYRCHTVPNESLVNQGEHSSGSDFVLLEWFDQISHNFLAATREGNGAAERKLTVAEKRVLWVVGWGLDLEYSYRGMANATGDGVFLKAMDRRAGEARRRLEDIHSAVTIPEVDSMLLLASGVQVAPNRTDQHRRNADRLAALNRQFVATRDGSDLASLDSLVGGWRPGGAAEAVAAAAAPAQAEGATSAPASGGGTAVGAMVAHVDPALPNHKALGLAGCRSCHKKSVQWWENDPHQDAAKQLQSQKGMTIARLYGLKPSEAMSADHLCLDCHAGRGAADPMAGVSCEGCHGPGADYKKPHKEGDLAMGLERTGYQEALKFGMTDLKRAAPMAVQCLRCHYITQDRLLSSGHPSGRFELAASHAKIKHWERSFASDAELQRAAAVEIKRRGGVPKVTLAAGADSVGSSAGSGGTGGTDTGAAGGASPGQFTIPPNASVSEVLILVRNRLREIHKAGGGP